MFGHWPLDIHITKRADEYKPLPLSPWDMAAGEVWTSIESGETQTIAQWESGYTLSQNNDGTLTAKLRFSGGIPDLTLRRIEVMFSEEEENATPSIIGTNLVDARGTGVEAVMNFGPVNTYQFPIHEGFWEPIKYYRSATSDPYVLFRIFKTYNTDELSQAQNEGYYGEVWYGIAKYIAKDYYIIQEFTNTVLIQETHPIDADMGDYKEDGIEQANWDNMGFKKCHTNEQAGPKYKCDKGTPKYCGCQSGQNNFIVDAQGCCTEDCVNNFAHPMKDGKEDKTKCVSEDSLTEAGEEEWLARVTNSLTWVMIPLLSMSGAAYWVSKR